MRWRIAYGPSGFSCGQPRSLAEAVVVVVSLSLKSPEHLQASCVWQMPRSTNICKMMPHWPGELESIDTAYHARRESAGKVLCQMLAGDVRKRWLLLFLPMPATASVSPIPFCIFLHRLDTFKISGPDPEHRLPVSRSSNLDVGTYEAGQACISICFQCLLDSFRCHPEQSLRRSEASPSPPPSPSNRSFLLLAPPQPWSFCPLREALCNLRTGATLRKTVPCPQAPRCKLSHQQQNPRTEQGFCAKACAFCNQRQNTAAPDKKKYQDCEGRLPGPSSIERHKCKSKEITGLNSTVHEVWGFRMFRAYQGAP